MAPATHHPGPPDSAEETPLLESSRVLLVDDCPANLECLLTILKRGGYEHIAWTQDSRSAVELFESLTPDIVLLDLHMPHIDGFQLMERFHKVADGGVAVPIVILTADADRYVKQRALAAGASDFLVKPFDPPEVLLRLRNRLETRFLQLRLQRQNLMLQERVRLRTNELLETHLDTLERLALAAESRDAATREHTRRVGHTASLMAEGLGLSIDLVSTLRLAAPLHDVGKVAMPDEILLKPGPLTPDEFERIKTHTITGARLLSGSRCDVTKVAEEVALNHHERWDGTGYPNGLREVEIPISGRIVSVADVFDALTNERPYKSAWSVADAVVEIESQAAHQFDPDVVEAFLDVRSSFSHA